MLVMTLCLGFAATLFACSTLFLIGKNKNLEKQLGALNGAKVTAYLDTNPTELLQILDDIMDRELAFTIELPYEGKDVKRIVDFEDSLKEITTNVINAVNKNFFDRAETIGLSTNFILDYITRGTTIRILKYIKDNNAGYTVTNDNEEVE